MVEVRSKKQAIFMLAKTVAKAIVEGRVDPFAGAQQLSHYAQRADYPEVLAEFYPLADEPSWRDHSRSLALIRADIIAEAKRLLALIPA